MQQTSSREPIAKSATPSSPSSISSPEFKASALAELRDWIAKGHCKVAGPDDSKTDE
jgi:hypothetical protein